MIEIMGLLFLAAVGGAILLGLLAVLWLFKLAFKIVLIPVGIALALLKLLVGVVLVVTLLTVGLPVLGVVLLLAPLALMAFLVWGGVCALGAVF